MRAALIIIIVVLLLAVGWLLWQKPRPAVTPSDGRPPLPAPMNGVRPPPPPESEEARAARAVASYLQAIYQSDCRRAYELLSTASRQKHSYGSFEAACRQGATDFELSSPKMERKNGGLAVTLSLAEEPATHSFLTVQENGEWKVVYLSGRPTFPYP